MVERRESASRLGERAALIDRFGRKVDIPMPASSERARIRGDVLRRLLGSRWVCRFAAAVDRMRGTDVSAGRHRRDVGRDRDE